MTSSKLISKVFGHKDKQNIKAKAGSQSQAKPSRFRGGWGIVLTRSALASLVIDPTSKHYNPNYGSGFEMWGNTTGNRLDTKNRSTSTTRAPQVQPQVIHHHHHYHPEPAHSPPQYTYRGYGGGASQGFEHYGSDRKAQGQR
uniref:Uncharacterized protein n=1 Tax=Kwoniella pini CBS 10737 TaxID=1296096 RepID=A0A1B9I7Q4_9TREE|nr:uncharacterized protein I206_02268 [Kwoniella pini CBS 10737]OCF51554.1 hypothetical protein I206_02268 [Kwoniella pini CBS 10737]